MKEYAINDARYHAENIGALSVCTTGKTELHRHKFVELIYICSGTGIQGINDIAYYVKHGDFLFVNYGQTHYIIPNGKLEYIEIVLDLEFLSRELIDANNAFDVLALTTFEDFHKDTADNTTSLVSFSGEEMLVVEHILKDIISELKNKQAAYGTILRSYMHVLFAKLLRRLTLGAPEQTASEKQDVMSRMLDYIRENLSEEISLQTLAEKSFYNPSYFSRAFKERFSMGLKAYVTKSRTEKAAKMLLETNLSISDIMQQCGFANHATMCRAFEQLYFTTPSEYRKSKR